ncbi:MAG: ArsA-related P-loop ATPase [Candidatus Nanopelagicales bacterium]
MVTPSGSVASWRGVQLHVVTGKGGTGKTTVAAALALALAASGQRTLICEVEQRQGFAQLFDVPPLPYEERRVAVAANRGEVYALAVDPEAALLEYLDMFYKLGRAGRALRRVGAVDFATTIAPGLRDVLLTGKIYEAVGRRRSGRRLYDAVVLDAPPTGRIGRFLNVNEEVAGLAKVGPVRQQSDSIMSLLRSPRTVVHLVTILEEMPTQETVDAAAELTGLGIHLGAVIVNRVRTTPLTKAQLTAVGKGRVDTAEIAAGLKEAGLAATYADALIAQTKDLAKRVALESAERTALSALNRPLVKLPWLRDGIDVGALYTLAGELARQGLR